MPSFPPSLAPLRAGPAGWAFPHWNGVVYPAPKPPGFHPLEFLAQHFDTLEIDADLHDPIKPEVARLWTAKVAHNRRFVFTAKISARFTAGRLLDPADAASFQDGLRPLADAGRLGCLVMEFPWSFRFTEENREFFIQLRRAFHRFPLVAEMRHASWMVDEALGVFIDYHVGFVNVDQTPYIKAMPPTAFLTSPTGYVRLHGRNNAGAPNGPDQRRNYFYSAAELGEWRERIERVRTHARQVFVVTTNDADGKSVLNALQIRAMFSARRVAPRGISCKVA
jgi:uncharacterized protein YecE (DUF72 family)